MKARLNGITALRANIAETIGMEKRPSLKSGGRRPAAQPS